MKKMHRDDLLHWEPGFPPSYILSQIITTLKKNPSVDEYTLQRLAYVRWKCKELELLWE